MFTLCNASDSCAVYHTIGPSHNKIIMLHSILNYQKQLYFAPINCPEMLGRKTTYTVTVFNLEQSNRHNFCSPKRL